MFSTPKKHRRIFKDFEQHPSCWTVLHTYIHRIIKGYHLNDKHLVFKIISTSRNLNHTFMNTGTSVMIYTQVCKLSIIKVLLALQNHGLKGALMVQQQLCFLIIQMKLFCFFQFLVLNAEFVNMKVKILVFAMAKMTMESCRNAPNGQQSATFMALRMVLKMT